MILKVPQQSITSLACPLRPRLSSPALSSREPVTPMRLRENSDSFTPSQAWARWREGSGGEWRRVESGGKVGSAKPPGAGNCFGPLWEQILGRFLVCSQPDFADSTILRLPLPGFGLGESEIRFRRLRHFRLNLDHHRLRLFHYFDVQALF